MEPERRPLPPIWRSILAATREAAAAASQQAREEGAENAERTFAGLALAMGNVLRADAARRAREN